MPVQEVNYLWEKVTDELACQIKSNAWEAGAKFYSADDIAAKFDVSSTTSRRILAELARMNLIQKSRGRGVVVKYAPVKHNIYVLSYADSVGVQYLFSTPIFSAITGNIQKTAEMFHSGLSLITPSQLLNIKRDNPVGVIIVQNMPCERVVEMSEFLRRDNVFGVLCHVPAPETWIATVRTDYRAAGRQVAEYLLGKGHKDFGWVGFEGQWKNEFVSPRRESFFNTLAMRGGSSNPDWMLELPANYAASRNILKKILLAPNRPTAIFTSNDQIASIIINFCAENDIAIPGELAIVGFDNREASRITLPPLTTIDTFWELQAEKAVVMVSEMLKQGRKIISDILIQPELVVRGSA